MGLHLDTRWRRPIGCLNLQVTFRERATHYRGLLREMTYKDKAPMVLHHLVSRYGMALSSRLLKIIGLFCRISSFLEGSFAKETCVSREPTNRSHPICYSEASLYLCIYV